MDTTDIFLSFINILLLAAKEILLAIPLILKLPSSLPLEHFHRLPTINLLLWKAHNNVLCLILTLLGVFFKLAIFVTIICSILCDLIWQWRIYVECYFYEPVSKFHTYWWNFTYIFIARIMSLCIRIVQFLFCLKQRDQNFKFQDTE